MNEYDCYNAECTLHFRRDFEEFSRIPGTDINTFLASTYAGKYVVCTGGSFNAIQLSAIRILKEISRRGGEESAMEAVFKMPSVGAGRSVVELFHAQYETQVYEIGEDGVLADIAKSIGYLDRASRYRNITYVAEDAQDLHDELVELIKAGKFNGADL